jgi:hypothetical protein
MRIVLCHHCWSWVPLEVEACPDCQQLVDLGEPDPLVTALDALFGQVAGRLATVRCERRQLPSLGALWGVGGGLLFLPELSQLPNGALAGPEEPTERFWPLPRLWPLWGRKTPSTTSRVANHSEPPSDLGERFLDSPGAVFVPRNHLIRAGLRGRTWTISRTVGRTQRFTILDSAEQARQAWRELLLRDPAWRPLADAG